MIPNETTHTNDETHGEARSIELDDAALDAVQGGARPRGLKGPTTQTEDDLYVG